MEHLFSTSCIQSIVGHFSFFIFQKLFGSFILEIHLNNNMYNFVSGITEAF